VQDVRRILVGVWGKDASKYVGRSMTLYRDPTVAFGGLQVGGIRISHMSDIAEDKTVALLVTRGRKAPFKIKPLVMQRPASEATAQSSAGASSTASGETTSNSGPTATSDASPSEVHPDQATKAAEIIAAIEAASAVMDVTSIVARNNLDIAAMPDELAVKIEIAADKRKRAIEAERAKAGAKEGAE
jgi:hypothetical protein